MDSLDNFPKEHVDAVRGYWDNQINYEEKPRFIELLTMLNLARATSRYSVDFSPEGKRIGAILNKQLSDWENDYYAVQPLMHCVEKFMGDGDNPDACAEVLQYGLAFRGANGRVYLNMRGRRLENKIMIGRR
ncbi:hypothetical protein Rleg2_5616 (plasmid) [Rhizobium leguminosarum bv. trifolii WSM2304]|uniref:Uncharacterized protein n=1 Tax=Rhizobium leguminosarum bv. trifolii (strain WSM2304) TaxID=395492 RepID=A0ABF7QXB7_RHILW|nr:hypothetical protein [Rhizobium leguminosarum]ACI58791.1 hypothetical protein Rleg2_5616 [Rhizobium leguminosarum bv. trifolii WSM2304]